MAEHPERPHRLVDCRVGRIFVKHGSALRKFFAYCSTADELQAAWRTLRQPLLEADRSTRALAAQHQSYLMAPVQQLTRYPIMLKQINKETVAQHPDKQELVEALDLLADAARYVEAKMEECFQSRSCNGFRRRFRDCPIADAHGGHWDERRLLQKGRLQKMRNDGSVGDIEAWLFSDIFVYAHRTDRGARSRRCLSCPVLWSA